MMNQFSRLLAGLKSVRNDFNEEMEEVIAFTEILAQKHNTLELDEDGFFYVTAAGTVNEVISTMEKQLDRLEKIKKQKDGI